MYNVLSLNRVQNIVAEVEVAPFVKMFSSSPLEVPFIKIDLFMIHIKFKTMNIHISF